MFDSQVLINLIDPTDLNGVHEICPLEKGAQTLRFNNKLLLMIGIDFNY